MIIEKKVKLKEITLENNKWQLFVRLIPERDKKYVQKWIWKKKSPKFGGIEDRRIKPDVKTYDGEQIGWLVENRDSFQ